MSGRKENNCIDYFAFVGTYPFGAPGIFTIAELLDEMNSAGITHSYVTDIGSLFLKEPTEANIAFIKQCSRYPNRLKPLPTIDLSVDTFERDMRKYREKFKVEGIRIAPNYHGYKLEVNLIQRFLKVLSEQKLLLFMARQLEDTRFQSACLGIQPLKISDVMPLIEVASDIRIILNNFNVTEIMDSGALGHSYVFFGISAFDIPFYSMERLVEKHTTSHLVFGSHVPFLYRGAVLYNLRNSFLSEKNIKQILQGEIR